MQDFGKLCYRPKINVKVLKGFWVQSSSWRFLGTESKTSQMLDKNSKIYLKTLTESILLKFSRKQPEADSSDEKHYGSRRDAGLVME